MEPPSSTHSEAIRDEQAKVLRTVRPMDARNIVRGQFRGYRDEPGVAKDSRMGTYAALRLHIDSWRWAGVPFYVRAGKSLAMTVTEVFVELKVPPQVVFNEPAPAVGNYVRFRLGPEGGHRAWRARQDSRESGMNGQRVELSRRGASAGRRGCCLTSACWATRSPATPRCSPGRTSSRRPGPSSIRSSRSPERCSSTSPVRGVRPRPISLVAEVGGWNTPVGG